MKRSAGRSGRDGVGDRFGHHLSLDAPQRRILILVLGLLITYGVVRWRMNPTYIDDPQPPAGDRSAELADKLDPNTASVKDLAALPGFGDKRAAELVAQRERMLARDPKTLPFRSPDDLFRVRGIGPSMADQLAPYFVFPTTLPATQSSQDIGRTSP